MGISDVIALFGGVALFLFGMTLMGDGLKSVAGNKLELILYRLSGTPLKGLLLGTGVTAVIQSSCATSVMVVGFVNSGMMKLKNSVSVIIGAILGTSVTGWVICLSYIEGAGNLKSLLSTATLTGVIAVAGIILRMFIKGRVNRHIGDILLGFAVLMFGMSSMSSAVGGLKDSQWFISMLTGLSNPLLGILAGAAFTALLQSASATVGIIQALSVTGAMSVSQALPLLMGVAIGGAAPVLLAAVGAGVNGKRAALIYPVGGGVGVGVVGALFYLLNAFIKFPFLSQTVNPFSIAAVNTFLRLAMA
ncbi:MAG: Na/Pi cotransporter family protein, partial [Clostridia bacterium]|nr:Na/Pi cotransporter family protein [Clostridia bacterium]